LPPRTPVAITVPMPGRIEGEVREKVTGALVSTYRIEARGPDGRIAGAMRKNGSSFVLSQLLPGRWTLDVRAPASADADRLADRWADVRVLGQRINVEHRLDVVGLQRPLRRVAGIGLGVHHVVPDVRVRARAGGHQHTGVVDHVHRVRARRVAVVVEADEV